MKKLLSLLLLTLLCSIGNVWGDPTLTLSKSSSDWTKDKSIAATVGTVSILSSNNAKEYTKKWGGDSNTSKLCIQVSSNSFYISSTAENIKKIEFLHSAF